MRGIITQLRDSVPLRALTLPESLHIAELQASKFINLIDLAEPPFPTEAIESIPRIIVERVHPLPISGGTDWTDGHWMIVLNAAEPHVRSRFTLCHEFKHILDHPFITKLYPDAFGVTSAERREQVCDYFAAALLMPRVWVKRYWGNGAQDPERLARLFDVSVIAMRRRLQALGLTERSVRCAA